MVKGVGKNQGAQPPAHASPTAKKQRTGPMRDTAEKIQHLRLGLGAGKYNIHGPLPASEVERTVISLSLAIRKG